jgi:hypothetical protein
MKNHLVEGIDFYYNDEGYMVLTASYHQERGYCCGNGCLHCPYDYENVPQSRRLELLSARRNEEGRSESS